MRMLLWISIAGFGLMGMVASASADVNWSGAGYYLGESAMGFDLELISGPYSNEADCKAALSSVPQNEQQDAFCDYFASDPLAGGN